MHWSLWQFQTQWSGRNVCSEITCRHGEMVLDPQCYVPVLLWCRLAEVNQRPWTDSTDVDVKMFLLVVNASINVISQSLIKHDIMNILQQLKLSSIQIPSLTIHFMDIWMAQCMTAVTPLQKHWSDRSLTLSHRYVDALLCIFYVVR